MFHRHGPCSAIDLIGPSLEHVEAVSSLPVLRRSRYRRTPVAIDRCEPSIQPQVEVRAAEQRIRIVDRLRRGSRADDGSKQAFGSRAIVEGGRNSPLDQCRRTRCYDRAKLEPSAGPIKRELVSI